MKSAEMCEMCKDCRPHKKHQKKYYEIESQTELHLLC